MIVKPLLNRLKSSSGTKSADQDRSTLIRLFKGLLQINDKHPLIPQYADLLRTSFDLTAVLVIYKKNNEVFGISSLSNRDASKFEQYDLNKSSWCLEIINSPTFLQFPATENKFPNDQLIKSTSVKTILSWPCFNENHVQTGGLCLLFSSQDAINNQEKQIVAELANKIGQILTKIDSTQSHFDLKDELEISQLLEKKLAELATANKSLESISYAISHDLRAPLRTIDSFSKALTEDYAGELTEEATSFLTRIRKACGQMRHMIDDLLLLSRITRRKLEKQKINLSKLTENIAQDLITAEHYTNVELNISPAAFATADQHLIKIAIQHLLDNALKFSGGKKTRNIDFFTTQKDGITVYAIKDNGCGFDMAYYDKLFEPFKFLHSASEYSGTGIGLAIVQKIIARHNGEIWAESDPGEGSVFYFTLGS